MTSAGSPYGHFTGTVSERASESEPAWPVASEAPQGAPNVVVVLVDDMGFADLAPFGSEIPTPNISRIAADGYVMTDHHSAPLCSPARAALLTGINSHRVGFGTVAHVDPGFPGFTMELPSDVATMPERFRDAGYSTFMVGKWHLTRDTLAHDAADKSSWPNQRGFDRYYGCMDGWTSLFHPHRLIRDNSPVPVDQYPDDYYMTDDLTDAALGMVADLRASSARKPFLLYFAHQAVHAPLQAPAEDIERFRGRYDVGWDRIRQARFERQKDLGLFADGIRLPAPDAGPFDGVVAWDDLPSGQRDLYARYMEVYAAMVASIDESVGRLVDALEEIGEYDNTIFVITSDNGASGEGGAQGTRSYLSQFARLPGLPDDWVRDVPLDPADIGSSGVQAHYPRGWARASNTPFRFYKGQTFAGGVHVPMIVSWPRGLPRSTEDRGIRREFTHVTDVLPTLEKLAGIPSSMHRHGEQLASMDGVPFDAVLRDPGAFRERRDQYVECSGHRAFFSGDLKAIALNEPGRGVMTPRWQLFDVVADPTETRDIAQERPEDVARLESSWRDAAWANGVFPLNDDGRMMRRRPPREAELEEEIRIPRGAGVIERNRSAKLVRLRSFRIDIEGDLRPTDSGVLVSHGDPGGGYLLYLLDGCVVLHYNAYGDHHVVRAPLPDRSAVNVRFTALADVQWRIEVFDANTRLCVIDRVPQLIGGAPFTGISVGADRGGPVSLPLAREHGSFSFSGALRAVRYSPGPKADYNPELIGEIGASAARSLD